MSRFALIANRQHNHGLNLRDVPVQGNKPSRIAAHDQFPPLRADRTTNQWVLFKYIDG